MFNHFTPNLTSLKGQYFWSAIEVLLQLGLYEFAAWIFDEIADECLNVEKYIMKTSFIFHLRRANKDFQTRQFPNEKIRNGENPVRVAFVNIKCFYFYIHHRKTFSKDLPRLERTYKV